MCKVIVERMQISNPVICNKIIYQGHSTLAVTTAVPLSLCQYYHGPTPPDAGYLGLDAGIEINERLPINFIDVPWGRGWLLRSIHFQGAMICRALFQLSKSAHYHQFKRN